MIPTVYATNNYIIICNCTCSTYNMNTGTPEATIILTLCTDLHFAAGYHLSLVVTGVGNSESGVI